MTKTLRPLRARGGKLASVAARPARSYAALGLRGWGIRDSELCWAEAGLIKISFKGGDPGQMDPAHLRLNALCSRWKAHQRRSAPRALLQGLINISSKRGYPVQMHPVHLHFNAFKDETNSTRTEPEALCLGTSDESVGLGDSYGRGAHVDASVPRPSALSHTIAEGSCGRTRVRGFGVRGSDFRFRVSGFGFRVSGCKFRISENSRRRGIQPSSQAARETLEHSARRRRAEREPNRVNSNRTGIRGARFWGYNPSC